MIPLYELRIGNWIMNNNSGAYYQIKKGIDIDHHSNSFLPVPITPEVLGKYGFSFHDYFKVWQKNKTIPGTGPDMELDRDFWVLNFSHQRIGVELKSLHQLQNLYFLLKGKELEMTK
ncbi:hypothetical protein OCK74_26195 [Chitinophagaceae bacterium LB-8]|uniref:Uncharacterized protein n=1 Tax=Paraflavisolibacter caeni TaxID=2982496 RepID=A0A9X3BKB6_9BACT|nr:hypothetical protein [Paraflavisolibacter caeni]MCU7552638.1 hypothetical protein [Paraflavisolibacter caeni]